MENEEGTSPTVDQTTSPDNEDADVPAPKPARKRVAAPTAGNQDNAVFIMEEVAEKLKILNYEEKLCIPKGMTPFPRQYFAVAAPNPGLQFQHMFECVKFLMKEARRDFATDKYDDPNTSINKLILELRNMNFELDFPPMKLRQAHGEPVCRVLNVLCDEALKANGFEWQLPVYPEDELAEEAEVDDEADIAADINDEIPDEEEEEEEVMYSEMIKEKKEDLDSSMTKVIESNIDPYAWKTELERVAPRLRTKNESIVVGREWRAHLEQSLRHKKTISSLFPETKSALEKIGNEVADVLEKVSAKEKYINTNFSNLASEYRTSQTKLSELSSEYETTSQTVASLTNELGQISDQLEEMKSQMDNRGDTITDTSPLVKIKQALVRIKNEIKTMEVRIAVVGHTIMQSKLARTKPGNANQEDSDFSDNDSSDLEFEVDDT